MMKIYPNLVNLEKIQTFLDYLSTEDECSRHREDVLTKSPVWDVDAFPQQECKNILDQLIDQPYAVDTVIFYDTDLSLKLHVDSGPGYKKRKIHVQLLIPLWFEGPATTLTFNNHWYDSNACFGREVSNPYAYNLLNREGNMVTVDDVRTLLNQCKNDPDTVKDFVVDEKFINGLEIMIRRRMDSRFGGPLISDYSLLTNYDANLKFNTEIYQTYLRHQHIEDFHGLTLDSIFKWELGSVMTFNRSQVHCAGYGHQRKKGLLLHTSLV